MKKFSKILSVALLVALVLSLGVPQLGYCKRFRSKHHDQS